MINLIIEQILKKAKKDPNRLIAKTPDEDFTPYVCHYDPNTILTKNGELLQIIRVTGFNNSTIASEIISLRETVRDAIKTHVKDNRIAFWFNTIRRKKNIAPKGKFDDIFSQELNKTWIKENSWDDQFVNELYITVIVEGIDTSIVNIESFLRSFSYFTTKSLHNKFLTKAHEKLSAITNNLIEETKGYGAKILGISEWEGVLYSEPMRFFGKISNLYEERYPVAANDISSDLSQDKIAFGNRELEVIGGNNKNYGAMLSLKEYFETSTIALDRILQLPFEFIITQSFDFAFTTKDLEPYEYQDYILQVSGDEELRQITGINDFIDSNQGLATDYGKLQTTIMVISKKREKLEQDVKSLLEQFHSLGFVAVREDIFMEHCFWSQLPANFRFLRRQKLINTDRIAGFAALHDYPSGSIDGNKWGSALTVLKTVLNTPYFFNFHDHDSGHSLILGPKDSGKTTLLNFLLAQSRKINPKIFYFDFDKSSKSFIAALNGNYYSFSTEEEFYEKPLTINPLTLTKNNENKNFLNQLFIGLLTTDQIPETEIDFIPQIVDRILTANITDFGAAIDAFNCAETKNIYENLKDKSEDLKKVFNGNKEIDFSSQTIAFDLEKIIEGELIVATVVNYLFHRIEKTLDGSPAIIAINKSWKIFDNAILGSKVEDLLKRLQEKNCIVIFVEDDFDRILESEISPKIREILTTEIFLPNPDEHECYSKVFSLNEEECSIIQVMRKEDNHFLFKHGEDSVIFSLNLDSMVEFLRILSANELTLTATEEVITASNEETKLKNTEPKIWLPQLLKILQELEKEMIEQEKQRIKEEQAEQRRIMKEKMGGPVEFE